MIKSMTAYGRSEHRTEDVLYTVEVRSLNHRYRDIILRIPKNFQVLDARFREVIAPSRMLVMIEPISAPLAKEPRGSL